MSPSSTPSVDCARGTDVSRRLCMRYVTTHPVAFREYHIPKVSKLAYWGRYALVPVLLALDGGTSLLAAGRGFGKSFAVLNPEPVRHGIARPGEETLLTALRKVHVVDRMEKVIEFFETVPYLRLFIKRIVRSPQYQVELHNGHTIYGVNVGDDPEAKMAQGKHCSRIIVEEAQQYPERAWVKIQGATDPRGCRFLLAGVPDGRLDTPYRKADTKYRDYEGRRFHLSRRLDPWFTQATKREFIEKYGGEERDDFMQEVDAKWGSPVWSAWDLDKIYRCFVTYERDLPRLVVEVSGKLYREQQLSPATVFADLFKSRRGGNVKLAVDVGYTQPSCVGVFEHDKEDRWNLVARVMLVNRMEHDDQATCIDWLGTFFGADQIAVDTTEGQGRAIVAELEKMERWIPQGLGEATVSPIVRVSFNETMVFDYTPTGEEVWDTVKEIGTLVTRRLFSEQAFVLPRDEDLPTDFNKEKETRGADGKVRVQTPSDVHIPDMFRCFAVMLFINSPPRPPGEPITPFVDLEVGDDAGPWTRTELVV